MSDLGKFDRSNVGGVIYALRKSNLRIGQEELSKELGIAQGSVSKIENGTLEMGVSLYYELLKYFNLSSDEFSELVDEYIRASLKAQKLTIEEGLKKQLVSNEIAERADRIRAAR